MINTDAADAFRNVILPGLFYGNVPAAFGLRFDDESCSTATVQMYGGIFAFRKGYYGSPYYAKAVRKTSPLSDAYTYDYFRSLASDCGDRLSMKAFSAAKQRIPGLGNGVLKALYQSTVTVMNEMTDPGGRDVERDLFGNYGRHRTYLSKKTLEEPCPGCGAPINKASCLGSNIFFAAGASDYKNNDSLTASPFNSIITSTNYL